MVQPGQSLYCVIPISVIGTVVIKIIIIRTVGIGVVVLYMFTTWLYPLLLLVVSVCSLPLNELFIFSHGANSVPFVRLEHKGSIVLPLYDNESCGVVFRSTICWL
jgi:hypothetical protein